MLNTNKVRASLERAMMPHDAIVVGAGAAGGMASLVLGKAGLNTLVLDAGLNASFLREPVRAFVNSSISAVADERLLKILPWRIVNLGRRGLKALGALRQPIQTRCYAWETAPGMFVDDHDNPYSTPDDAPFQWFRARGVGGRMVVPAHGRQYYRLSNEDFNPSDGQSPAWPFTLDELNPWYSAVERALRLNGRREQIDCLPDSEIVTSTTPSSAERRLIEAVESRWPGYRAALSRYAPPQNSIAEALATGNVDLRDGAVACEVLLDGDGKADGVRWVDRLTGSKVESRSPLVFLCCGALESTRLMLLSRGKDGENGIGRGSGMLGRNLMDHVMVKAEGIGGDIPDELERPAPGRCVYLPRFDARGGVSAGRGFGVQLYQSAGANSKSYFTAVAFSEMLPRSENRIEIDPHLKDRWGIPSLRIVCRLSDDERARARQQAIAIRELSELAGARIDSFDGEAFLPGSAIHECGTARMGSDPATSVLSPFNECWEAPGLYNTDGASFPSQGSQNPTLTILALTARACAHASGSSDFVKS